MAMTGLSSAYGNCCGSPKTYVTNNHSSSGNHDRDEKIEKRKKKIVRQNHYEKRKYLRKQFEDKQVRKALIRGQLQGRQEEKEVHESLQGKSAFSGKRNVFRAITRYEASILKS